MTPTLSSRDRRVRRAILETLAAGGIPTRIGVMQSLDLESAEVAASYAVLAAGHVIVLDSDTGEVWMAMPFSAVSTGLPRHRRRARRLGQLRLGCLRRRGRARCRCLVRVAVSGLGRAGRRRSPPGRAICGCRVPSPTSACRRRGGGTTSATPDRRSGSSGRKRTSSPGPPNADAAPTGWCPCGNWRPWRGAGIAAGSRPTGGRAPALSRRPCSRSWDSPRRSGRCRLARSEAADRAYRSRAEIHCGTGGTVVASRRSSKPAGSVSDETIARVSGLMKPSVHA